MRHYKSAVTGGSFMEAMGEGFLNLVRDSERLSGRRPLLEQMGDATRLTIYAARHVSDDVQASPYSRRAWDETRHRNNPVR